MEEIEIIDPYGFIYLTTNIINGKKYIGQRVFDERCNWKTYLGSGKHFKRAVNKYGRENFSREIVSIAYSKEEINLLEIEFIKNHDAVKSEDYYNLSSGGEGGNAGSHYSEESKLKLSKARKGIKYSEDSKKKMSEAQKGKPKSEEHRKNIAKVQIKLNELQVIEIREKYSTGKFTYKQLAIEYFVGTTTITRVLNFQGVYKVA